MIVNHCMITTVMHACTQVYSRLQKLILCLSRKATLNMLDVVADGHDEAVLEWRDKLLNRVVVSADRHQVYVD